ncbi:MAG: DM13 domain-containing protein [Solirubrobacterales bacterium]
MESRANQAGSTAPPRDLRSMLLTAVVTASVLGIGSLVLQRFVAQTRGAAIAMVVAWFLVVLVGLLIAVRSRPELRLPGLATFAAVLIGTVAIGYWTGFRDTEVNEEVAVAASEASGAERAAALRGDGGSAEGSDGGGTSGGGSDADAAPKGPVSLASGTVEGADGHAGNGRAEVVETGGHERVLNLTDLSLNPGPDVDVFLSTSTEGIDDAVNLGDLKGSSGNQEYPIPAGTDLTKYSNVVIYCHPFTVRIAVAPLDA